MYGSHQCLESSGSHVSMATAEPQLFIMHKPPASPIPLTNAQHIAMDGSSDTIAEETLFALEARLRRIEFVLAGCSEDPIGELYALRKSGKESSVKSRLNSLERDLSRLATKSRTVKDMLDLRLSLTDSVALVHLP